MVFLLCRNRVKDVAQWKAVFESHRPAHRESGLQLAHYHFVSGGTGY